MFYSFDEKKNWFFTLRSTCKLFTLNYLLLPMSMVEHYLFIFDSHSPTPQLVYSRSMKCLKANKILLFFFFENVSTLFSPSKLLNHFVECWCNYWLISEQKQQNTSQIVWMLFILLLFVHFLYLEMYFHSWSFWGHTWL